MIEAESQRVPCILQLKESCGSSDAKLVTKTLKTKNKDRDQEGGRPLVGDVICLPNYDSRRSYKDTNFVNHSSQLKDCKRYRGRRCKPPRYSKRPEQVQDMLKMFLRLFARMVLVLCLEEEWLRSPGDVCLF